MFVSSYEKRIVNKLSKCISVICIIIFIVTVKDLVEKREIYKHRVDKLETKVHNMTTGLITEFFTPGRLDCLKGQSQLITSPSVPCTISLALFSAQTNGESLRMRSRPENMPFLFKSVWFSLSLEFLNFPSTSEHY